MVEADFELWESLLFRDYLTEHPFIAKEYENIKINLSKQNPDDRIKYTQLKSNFIKKYTSLAREWCKPK